MESCLTNLNKCNAECCKVFRIKKDKRVGYIRGMVIYFKCSDKDLQFYFELRGFQEEKGYIKLTLDKFKTDKNYIYIFSNCKYLTKDNLCINHDEGKRPKICGFPENYKGNNVYITPNCIYKEEKT
jgi:hypothetical protein